MLCKPMLEFTAKKRTAREEDGKGKKTDGEGRGEGSEWRRTGWGVHSLHECVWREQCVES